MNTLLQFKECNVVTIQGRHRKESLKKCIEDKKMSLNKNTGSVKTSVNITLC